MIENKKALRVRAGILMLLSPAFFCVALCVLLVFSPGVSLNPGVSAVKAVMAILLFGCLFFPCVAAVFVLRGRFKAAGTAEFVRALAVLIFFCWFIISGPDISFRYDSVTGFDDSGFDFIFDCFYFLTMLAGTVLVIVGFFLHGRKSKKHFTAAAVLAVIRILIGMGYLQTGPAPVLVCGPSVAALFLLAGYFGAQEDSLGIEAGSGSEPGGTACP